MGTAADFGHDLKKFAKMPKMLKMLWRFLELAFLLKSSDSHFK
jgi:hypothetical protein